MASATVQSWQDSSWTRRAITEGHDVIASPSEWTYLNRSAGDLTLDHVYAFEPVPPGLDSAAIRHVLGGEAPLWSEHIVSAANLDLMAFPRLLAFAEVMWSDGPRDLVSLRRRLEGDELPRLRAMGVAVGPADRELMGVAVVYDSAAHAPRIRTVAGVPGIVLRERAGGRAPTAASPIVPDSTLLDGDGVRRLQPFFGAEPILNERILTIERHHAVGAKVQLATPPDRRYPGTGTENLVDGLHGSSDHADGLWQGWLGPDVDAVVELDSAQTITTICIDFLQNIRSWIALPRQVEFSWSIDNVHWSSPMVQDLHVPMLREGAIIQPFEVTLPAGTRARFIRVIGRNAGVLPAGHPGAGTPSWLFADEIVVW
jgi:hexosaminidase